MRRSKFRRPCKVLIFNGARVLVAIVRSLHCAAELTHENKSAIHNCPSPISLFFGIFLGSLPLLINCYGRITLFKIHRKGFGYIFVPEIKI